MNIELTFLEYLIFFLMIIISFFLIEYIILYYIFKKNFYIPENYIKTNKFCYLSHNIYLLNKQNDLNDLIRLGIGISVFAVEKKSDKKSNYYCLMLCQKPIFILFYQFFYEVKKITNCYLIFSEKDIFTQNKNNLIITINDFNVIKEKENIIYIKNEI